MKNFTAVLLRLQRDERGSVLILTLMILAILTILGLAATQSTFFEMQVASNDRFYRQSFEAAENGLSVVIADPVILGDSNLNTSAPVTVVNDPLGYRAVATYQGPSQNLRGKGQGGKFRAHDYTIVSTGQGSQNARTQVSVQGFRVGF